MKGGNMKKIFLIVIILLVLPMILALDNLGTFKQNSCVRLVQTCVSCSYVNISSVSNSATNNTLISNVEMISSGNGEWYYNFCDTDEIGRYDVRGKGDIDGADDSFVYYFEITPSGFQGTLGFYIILICICAGVIILGFSIGEAWFVILGGFALIILGIYSINSGVAGFRDMFVTWAIGIFEISIGSILAIGSAIEKIED
jgi:hypothetical protein